MTLIAFEGWNDQAATLGKGWTSDTPTYDSSLKRTGQSSANIGSFGVLQRPLLVAEQHAKTIVGVATNFQTFGPPSTIAIADSNNAVATVAFNLNGTVHVTNFDGTDLGAVATYSLNTWDYWEFQTEIGTSLSGKLILCRNGNHATPVYSNSAVTTSFNGATVVTSVLLRAGNGGGFHVDDFYLLKNDGSGLTAFLGDVKVETLFPNGAGARSAWTGAFTDVNENPPSMTQFIHDNVVSDYSQFTMDDLVTTSGTVYAVQGVVYGDKSDTATVRQFILAGQVDGTNFDGLVTQTLSTAPEAFVEIMETKPAGGSWSIASVNGMQAGVKLTA